MDISNISTIDYDYGKTFNLSNDCFMGSCMATVNSEQNKPKKNASLLTLDD